MSQTFSGQRKDEEVLFIFRRHIMTARKGLYILFFAILASFIPLIIWSADPSIYPVLLIFFAVGACGLSYYCVLWHFSIYIVTNERIRQVQQKSFFKKVVVDLSLDKISSISYSIPGFFGTICGYGTIIIQTVVGDLIISYAAHPERVYNQLQNLIDKVGKQKESNAKTDIQA